MATTANKNNIVKRIDVSRKLTFLEMDTNFEQLKLTIDDVATIDGQLANKVDQSVYDTKIANIDASIFNLENVTLSEGRIDLIETNVSSLDTRVTANETSISTLNTNVSSNDTDIAALDTRVSATETDIAALTDSTTFSALETRVTTNEGDITTLQTNVSTLQTNVSSNDTDIAGLTTRVSSAETNISSNDTDIAALDTRVTNNEGGISSLNTTAASFNTRITDNEGDISTLQTNVAEALVPSWTSISGSTTLTVNTRYAVDFSIGPLNLVLPLSPAANDFVVINKDGGKSKDSIISRNGNTIMGKAENMTIDYEVASVHLVYNGTDWRIV